MNVIEKVERVKVLKSEIKSIRVDFQTEMFDYIHQEFRKLGFVTDPRGEDYKRGLYNPELKISIWVQNITVNSAGINVYDMVNDGMNYGKNYNKIVGGLRFNYSKVSFEKFYNTTFKNRVKKLEEVLAD
jgi:hypothetical protein